MMSPVLKCAGISVSKDIYTGNMVNALMATGEFEKLTGRKYNIVEKYDMEDAEVAIVALGTTVESARIATKEARKNGIKAGVVSIGSLRPFPYLAFFFLLFN